MCLLHLAGPGAGISLATSQQPITLKRLTSDAKLRTDEGLNRIIGGVRASFLDKDPEKLADHFGSTKIYLSMKTKTQEAGYYTGSQLQFIFDKMFQDLQIRSFEYSKKDITILGEKNAYCRAEWTYVALGSDAVVTERLIISFAREREGWKISEIRAR
jgi:hypothetical protein